MDKLVYNVPKTTGSTMSCPELGASFAEDAPMYRLFRFDLPLGSSSSETTLVVDRTSGEEARFLLRLFSCQRPRAGDNPQTLSE